MSRAMIVWSNTGPCGSQQKRGPTQFWFSKGYLKLHTGEQTSTNPWLIYSVWAVLCALIFLKPLKMLVLYSLHNDNASHILLVPVIVLWLLYTDRPRISRVCAFDFLPALLFAVPAVLLGGLALRFPDVSSVSLSICALILWLIAGYI